VRIWDVNTGIEVQTLVGHTSVISSVAFSLNGHQLASASWDNTVRVWDMSAGGTVHGPTTRTTCITCCAFSPSGMQFATGSRDGTVWIWDSHTGVPIGSSLSHSHQIKSMYYHERTGVLLLVVKDWNEDLTVWNMSVTPPSLFSTHHPLARPTPSHSLFEVESDSNCTFIPAAGISFYLPSSFRMSAFDDPCSSHEGRIVYGEKGGTVILIDCSHLLPKPSVYSPDFVQM
jgi:WD40 repeat protein